MLTQAPEIIDLTGASPQQCIVIHSDSDGSIEVSEINPSTSASRKKKKPRRTKRKKVELEEGEIGGSSVDASRAQSMERHYSDGGLDEQPVNEGTGERGERGGAAAKRGDAANGTRSLLDRLTSPKDEESKEIQSSESKLSRRRKERKRKRKENGSDEYEWNDKQEKGYVPDSTEDATSSLFFVDVQKSDLPSFAKPKEPGPSKPPDKLPETETKPSALLLPAHVTVIGESVTGIIQIIPSTKPDFDEESYIEYLDYDDDRKAPGMVRYFEQADENEKQVKPKTVVCKNCGAEGAHKTYECPVMICLTCGAHDEHPTRSCPISKTCFNCGMKGHINRTCPNRYSGRGDTSYYDDCDRCGSRVHKVNECPTLWRMYNYVEDAERQVVLHAREEKQTLALGQGGEGYIATDEWCYNCGGSGHLGDDCEDLPHPHDFPREPSAFGSYNLLSGPFADTTGKPAPTKRVPRDWEAAAAFAAQWLAPMDVGKQGRRKERERLEKRAREAEQAHDDLDDWFARGRSGSGRGDKKGTAATNGGSGSAKKITIDFSSTSVGRDRDGRRDGHKRDTFDLPPPSRETESISIRGASKRQEERRYDYGRDRERDRGRDRRDRVGDRDRDSRRWEDRGPRYKGGYSR